MGRLNPAQGSSYWTLTTRWYSFCPERQLQLFHWTSVTASDDHREEQLDKCLLGWVEGWSPALNSALGTPAGICGPRGSELKFRGTLASDSMLSSMPFPTRPTHLAWPELWPYNKSKDVSELITDFSTLEDTVTGQKSTEMKKLQGIRVRARLCRRKKCGQQGEIQLFFHFCILNPGCSRSLDFSFSFSCNSTVGQTPCIQ